MGQPSRGNVSVRPVQWNTLLGAIDLIAGKDKADTSLFERYMGVSAEQSQEIARVLCNIGLVKRSGFELTVQPLLEEFVKNWEQGDLLGLSQLLQKGYLPYQRFIEFVKENSPVEIPKRSEDETFIQIQQEQALTQPLKPSRGRPRRQRSFTQQEEVLAQALEPYGLNLASFEMLTRFASRLGAVYVSHDYVHFAENRPSQEKFEEVLLEEYDRLKIPEGYASMGEVADAVCRKLGISMLTFDEYFKRFYDTNYSRIRTSSAVMLAPETPREMVFLQKRGSPTRFDRRQLVDGVNVYQTNIKAFKVVQNG